MRAVKTFRLVFIGKSDKRNNFICVFCDFLSLFYKACFIACAFKCIAVGISKRLSAFCQCVRKRNELCRIDARASCSLIADMLCKCAHDGDFFVSVKWQNIVFVFKENRTLRRGFSCKLVVFVVIGFIVRHFFCLTFKSKFNQTQNDFVKVGFVKSAFFDCFYNFVVVHSVVARHFEVVSCFHAFDAVVDSAPVGNGDAFIAPFVTKNIGEKFFVFTHIFAIYLVVARHNGCRLFGFDGMFKSREIDFTQCAFVANGVYAHTDMFLIVCAKVFKAYADILTLNAVNPACAHLTCKIRIFGKIFKVSSAKRRTLYVYARS